MSHNELFLPKEYKENIPLSSEVSGTPFFDGKIDKKVVCWQMPVYELAKNLASTRKPNTILDVGCGTGYKTYNFLAKMAGRVIGIDQHSGITIAKQQYSGIEWVTVDVEDDSVWGKLKAAKPELIVCADVIEHLPDPISLLKSIKSVMTDDSVLLISTPDRNKLEGATFYGPPTNNRHIREWTAEELTLLFNDLGLNVLEVHHLLPRKFYYSLHNIARFFWRLFTLKKLPDNKSCMAFLVSTAS